MNLFVHFDGPKTWSASPRPLLHGLSLWVAMLLAVRSDLVPIEIQRTFAISMGAADFAANFASLLAAWASVKLSCAAHMVSTALGCSRQVW